MISITTPTFDLSGELLIKRFDVSRSRLEEYTRRITRTATLDGGAWANDGGYSDADRTLNISITAPDQDIVERAKYLIQNYSDLTIAIPDGVFVGKISEVSHVRGVLRIVILLTGLAGAS